jgi:hypothetical protein
MTNDPVLARFRHALGVNRRKCNCSPWHDCFLFPLKGAFYPRPCRQPSSPWLEKYQGRAVSIISLGVSAGGMMCQCQFPYAERQRQEADSAAAITIAAGVAASQTALQRSYGR